MANPPDVRTPTFGEGDGPLSSSDSAVVAKYKPADQTILGATFEDDDDLSFTLTGSAEYVFEFVVFYSTSVANEAYDMSLNGPGGPGILRYVTALNTSATTRQTGVKTAYDSGLGLTAGFGTTPFHGRIEGYVAAPPGGGTLVLRHKIETGGGESATIYAGSHAFLRRVN